jgi:hypothetical protein
MDYTTKSNNITFTNGYSIDFEFPIKETLLVGNVIVVESPYDVRYPQNVFAISSSGDFLWRISDTELFYDGPDPCFFNDAILNEKNELVLFNWCDTAVVVDIESGSVIRKYHTK